MKRQSVSYLTLVSGLLCISVGACSGSESSAPGTGGTTGLTGTTGGSPTASSGGVTNPAATTQPTPNGGNTFGGNSSTSSISVTGGTTGTTETVAAGGPSGGASAIAAGGTLGTGGTTTAVSVVGGTSATGGRSATGGTGSGGHTGGSTFTGTCTASKSANVTVSGSGPHKVTVETNAGSGINEGTIYRPTDLGGAEKYPIFVWGEGGCSVDGLSNSTAMAEIASYGYFVIADGTPKSTSPNRSMDGSSPAAMGKPLIRYLDWAIAENSKPCSAYYQSLDATKIASNGFSCGGLMAEGTAGDPRMTTWGLNSSGLFAANPTFYKTIHTPVLLVEGGTSDMAYPNGQRDYDNISALGIPIVFFSKNLGHGGDLWASRGGDFTKINLAWLNWWLKGDLTATGKGLLIGSSCPYCKDSAWEVKSKNIP